MPRGGAWAQAIALSFKFLFLVVAILGLGWLVVQLPHRQSR